MEVEKEMDGLERKLSVEGDANSSPSSEDNSADATTFNADHLGESNEMDDIPEHLRQFDVLDEVQGDDSGSENGENEPRGKQYTIS